MDIIVKEKIIATKVFVLNKDGLFLAIRRSKTDPLRPLTWDIPGGILDYGEDPDVGVIRETQEETGITLKKPIIFNVDSLNVNENMYIVRLIYYEVTKHSDVVLSYEHDLFKWVTRSDFLKLEALEFLKESVKLLP
jgi:8-oxo-dGTP diphosphatase